LQLSCDTILVGAEGFGTMAEYRVYRLDGVTRKTSAESIEAQTDAEAVDLVRMGMGTSVTCEIWRGNRVVERLEASQPRDFES
jgi:hypothetical protein